MVNEKEHMLILLKNALEAIDKADIQRARDLINNACMAVEGWKQTDEWSVAWRDPCHDPCRPNDALLKEFGW